MLKEFNRTEKVEVPTNCFQVEDEKVGICISTVTLLPPADTISPCDRDSVWVSIDEKGGRRLGVQVSFKDLVKVISKLVNEEYEKRYPLKKG